MIKKDGNQVVTEPVTGEVDHAGRPQEDVSVIPGPRPSLKELIAQQEALQRQQDALLRNISAMRDAQKAEVVNDIKKLMASHGLTVSDLAEAKRGASPRAAKQPGKVAAKYRDPDSGSTWTGRGLKPRWLAAAIEAGRTQTEFLIEVQPS